MSTTSRMKVPGPDHPISIERTNGRVVVTLAGTAIADTREALILSESDYDPVYYIRREDVDMTRLERSTHATSCPYKGDCSYYSIAVGGSLRKNAVWTYEDPYPYVAQIRNYLAFYPDAVDSIEIFAP